MKKIFSSIMTLAIALAFTACGGNSNDGGRKAQELSGAGATFPVVLNFIGGAFKDLSGTAFSIAMFIGLCGQSLGNKIMGLQFDSGVYGFLPVCLIICVAIMMVLVPTAVKVSQKK